MKTQIAFTFLFLLVFCSYGQNQQAKDAAETEYLAAQKELGRKFSDAFYPNYAKMHQLSEKAFTAKIDSSASGFYRLLNFYKPKLSPAYVSAQTFEIKLFFDKILIEYPANHEIYTEDRPKNYPVIDQKIKSNLPLFNDPKLLGNSDLMPFIQSFLAYKVQAKMKSHAYDGLYNKRLLAIWDLVPTYVTNPRCRTYHQYQILLSHLKSNGIKHTEDLYAKLKKQSPDPAMLAELEKIYADARNDLKDHLVRQYKSVGGYGLDLHIFQKDGLTADKKKPVIVFFHGGSWSEGQAAWHFEACRKYAEKGWIACSVEYRIYGAQGTLPFAAVMDARSAIRWLREHGQEFNIDTSKIVASGNSSGGHLVLATALAEGWNEESDNLRFSPVPNVLLVNSGVYDLTDEKTAWIRKDLADKNLVKGISPIYLSKTKLPPTLLIHSKADYNVPYVSAEKFAQLMNAAGRPVQLKTLEQGGHFIFDHPAYTPTVFAWRRAFLDHLGYPDNNGD